MSAIGAHEVTNLAKNCKSRVVALPNRFADTTLWCDMKQQRSASKVSGFFGLFPVLALAVGLTVPLSGCGYNDVITLDEGV